MEIDLRKQFGERQQKHMYMPENLFRFIDYIAKKEGKSFQGVIYEIVEDKLFDHIENKGKLFFDTETGKVLERGE